MSHSGCERAQLKACAARALASRVFVTGWLNRAFEEPLYRRNRPSPPPRWAFEYRRTSCSPDSRLLPMRYSTGAGIGVEFLSRRSSMHSSSLNCVQTHLHC